MVIAKNKLFGIILFLITLTSINTGFCLTDDEILQMDKDAYAAEIAVPTENARRAAKMATTILHNKAIAPADKRAAIQGHIDTATDQAKRVNDISAKSDYNKVPQATKDEAKKRVDHFVAKARDCLNEARAREHGAQIPATIRGNCGICWTEESLPVLSCGHKYCTDCLKGHIDNQLGQGRAMNGIPCPSPTLPEHFFTRSDIATINPTKLSFYDKAQTEVKLYDIDLSPEDQRDIWNTRIGSNGSMNNCPNCNTTCALRDGCLLVQCLLCKTEFCLLCSAISPGHIHPKNNCPIPNRPRAFTGGVDWFLGEPQGYKAQQEIDEGQKLRKEFLQKEFEKFKRIEAEKLRGMNEIFSTPLDIPSETASIDDITQQIERASERFTQFINTCLIANPNPNGYGQPVNYYTTIIKTLANHLIDPLNSHDNMDLLYGLSRKVFGAYGITQPAPNDHQRNEQERQADRAVIVALCQNLMQEYDKQNFDDERQHINWSVTKAVIRSFNTQPGQALPEEYKRRIADLQKKQSAYTKELATFKANIAQAIAGSMRNAEPSANIHRITIDRNWLKNGSSILTHCDQITQEIVTQSNPRERTIMSNFIREAAADAGGPKREFSTLFFNAFTQGPNALFEQRGDYFSPLSIKELVQTLHVPEQEEVEKRIAHTVLSKLVAAAEGPEKDRLRHLDKNMLFHKFNRAYPEDFKKIDRKQKAFMKSLPKLRKTFFDAHKDGYKQLYEAFGHCLYLSIVNGLGVSATLPSVFWAQLFKKIDPNTPAPLVDWLSLATNFYGQTTGAELIQRSPVQIFFDDQYDCKRLIDAVSNPGDPEINNFPPDPIFSPSDGFPLKKYMLFIRYLKAKLRCVETCDGKETMAMESIRNGFFKHLGKPTIDDTFDADRLTAVSDLLFDRKHQIAPYPQDFFNNPYHSSTSGTRSYQAAMRNALLWLTPEDFTFGISMTPADPATIIKNLKFEEENGPALAQYKNLIQALKETIIEYIKNCDPAQRAGFLQEVTGTPRYVDESVKIIFVETQDEPNAIFRTSTCDRFIRVPVDHFNQKLIELHDDMQGTKDYLKELLKGLNGKGGAFNVA